MAFVAGSADFMYTVAQHINEVTNHEPTNVSGTPLGLLASMHGVAAGMLFPHLVWIHVVTTNELMKDNGSVLF